MIRRSNTSCPITADVDGGEAVAVCFRNQGLGCDIGISLRVCLRRSTELLRSRTVPHKRCAKLPHMPVSELSALETLKLTAENADIFRNFKDLLTYLLTYLFIYYTWLFSNNSVNHDLGRVKY